MGGGGCGCGRVVEGVTVAKAAVAVGVATNYLVPVDGVSDDERCLVLRWW